MSRAPARFVEKIFDFVGMGNHANAIVIVYICLSPPGNPIPIVSRIINCTCRILYIKCAGWIDFSLQHTARGFASIKTYKISGHGQMSVIKAETTNASQ